MKTKITLVGARLSYNLGGPSLLASTIDVLNSVFDKPEYTLIIPYKTIKEDEKLAPQYGVKVLPLKYKIWTLQMFLLRRFFHILWGPQDQKQIIRAIEQADVVIDIWGIMYADTLNTKFLYRLTDGIHLWFSKLFKKTVIKYTAALGPFETKTNRFFAKWYLGRCTDLIIARDPDSMTHLEKLKIKTPTYVIPDTAFLLGAMDSPHSDRIGEIKNNKPVICISVSYQSYNREKRQGLYTDTMAAFIKYINDTIHAHIILLPNELAKSKNDDTKVAKEILSKVECNDCEMIDTENLLAQEIKGIVNKADLVIAARYHTIVAALSLGIPTLAIGWHHKYIQILDLFGQKNWLCNINELSLDELVSKFKELWAQRDEQKKNIQSNVPIVRQKILEGGKLIKSVYSSDK